MSIQKIGPGAQTKSTEALRWASVAPCVKAVNAYDLLVAAKQANPSCVTVYRHYFGDQRVRNGAEVADIVINAAPNNVDYYEMYNEWKQFLYEGLADHVTMMRQFADRCHQRGKKCVGFNFSVYNPRPEDWQYVADQGFANVDVLGVHEYWGGIGFQANTALRHRQVPGWIGYRSHPPFFITECGRDAVDDHQGCSGNCGWEAQVASASQYANEIYLYDIELRKDSDVDYAFVFGAGPTSDWVQKGFDTDHITEEHILPMYDQQVQNCPSGYYLNNQTGLCEPYPVTIPKATLPLGIALAAGGLALAAGYFIGDMLGGDEVEGEYVEVPIEEFDEDEPLPPGYQIIEG
jgi:hypothetical protein